ELRRPGEVEQVVVEVLCGRGLGGKRRGVGTRDRFGYGFGPWITRLEGKKKVEENGDESLLHSASSLSGSDRISHITGFLRKQGYNSFCCKWLSGLERLARDCD